MRTRAPIRWLSLAVACLAVAAAAAPAHGRGEGGFLRQWLLVDPLEGTDLGAPKVPEAFAAYPGLYALDRIWLPAEVGADGKLDLRERFAEPPTGTALLFTYLEVPKAGEYVLRVGSDDAVRIDIDGRPVHREDAHRAWRVDQDTAGLRLEKGWHRVLVRVVEYGAQWAVSVRVADAKNRPVDLRHQVAVPEPLRDGLDLGEDVPLKERAAVAMALARRATGVHSLITEARERLRAAPEGYVTFAEYEGARNHGLAFFDALDALWRAIGEPETDGEALRAAEEAALAAAGALGPGLVPDTRRLVGDMADAGRAWHRLGETTMTRQALAEATLDMAALLEITRQLAERVEREHLLAARLENDIRNLRQRDLTVRVVDAEGGPVEDATVEIVQTEHAFAFGCNAFALDRFKDRKQNETYRKRFEHLFNTAVVPVYWTQVEPKAGRPDWRSVDAALAWAEMRKLRVRAHALLWPEALPRHVEGLDADAARRAVREHLRRTVERYRDRVAVWDVLNEPSEDGRVGPCRVRPEEALAWAAEAAPEGGLAIVASDAARLADLGRALREAKAPLAAVGLAAQQHAGAWPAALVRSEIDRAARAGLPVDVAAVTILGGPDDEARQAQAVERFYTAAFAHPRVASLTWWDLSDRFAWRNAPAGLLRADLSPKPAYKALERLLRQLWRTDAAGRSGEDGRLTVRAFHGRYRITAKEGRRKATVRLELGPRGPRTVEVVLPAGR